MTTVNTYIAGLPEDRRTAVTELRAAILARLPEGYEEGMQYGMIGYYIPHSRWPAGYHCDPKQPMPFAHIGSLKSHLGVYLFCLYMNPELQDWFRGEYEKMGKKLDMGKGCVRFKRMEDVPCALIGELVARVPVATFLERYESQLPASAKKKAKKAG